MCKNQRKKSQDLSFKVGTFVTFREKKKGEQAERGYDSCRYTHHKVR